MPSKVKKTKMEFKNVGEEFVFSKLELSTKNIKQENFYTNCLETYVEDLEDNLEMETKPVVRDICEKNLTAWERKVEEVRSRINTHYDTSSESEKAFLHSLSAKRTQLAETVDREGNHHYPGFPPTYLMTEEDLRSLLADMKTRVQAIEHELLLREFEKVVYELFI